VSHLVNANKMVGDTPRTESFNCYDNGCDNPLHAWGAFSAELERELNVANERIKRLEDSIEKLKDAGDLVFIWLLYNRSHLGGLDVDSALREWKQSKKEAKP